MSDPFPSGKDQRFWLLSSTHEKCAYASTLAHFLPLFRLTFIFLTGMIAWIFIIKQVDQRRANPPGRPPSCFATKRKKSIDSLPQSFLKYNTWRFSSAVLPSVGGLRRGPTGGVSIIVSTCFKNRTFTGINGSQLQNVSFSEIDTCPYSRGRFRYTPSTECDKNQSPTLRGAHRERKKNNNDIFFFLPSSSLGSDKKHAVTRFPLADKRLVLISGSLVISWETRVVWEIDVGIGVGFGKRVETEPFVATCLGVGRTQETLSASFYLFFFSRQISNEYSYCQSLLLAWLHPALFAII